ncbi:unnamed protein product [Enterobius vermicularis]|uniref:SSD domain-containing protein n=1 Tax=Enterobius vermicularis TaxID=51028 RepID=A0A3P6HI01_ENTVE|nr:unnamed protein product [Enterobius vermicularis]
MNCSWLKLQVTRSTQVSFSNDNNCWLVGRSVDGNSGTGILALHRCIFWHIGTFIGQHYGSCSFLTFMFAVALSCFNIYLRFDDDFRSGYSQLDSQSEIEHGIFLNFNGLTKQPYTVMLVGESVDGGSMLRKEQFMVMRNEIARGLSTELNITSTTGFFRFFPRYLKDLVLFSDDTQFNVIESALTNPGPNAQIGYPVAKFFGQNIIMARAIYGYKDGGAKMLAYSFGFTGDNPYLEFVKKAEVLWSERLKSDDNNITRMRLFGDSVVNSEISSSAFGACPYFLVGSALMILFVFLTLFRYSKNSLHAFYLTFWTICCPLLAGACTMAIISSLGVPVNCAMLITPFLVLGIGVDDAFLMIHHWYNSQKFSKVARLRYVMLRTGPSITLTSVTNITAFLIGSYVSAPDLRLFCLSAALAFSLDWILQVFLFSPMLLFLKDVKAEVPLIEKKSTKSFGTIYSEWLRLTWVRVVLSLVVLAYWTAGIYGGVSMEENFSPEKTFDSQSFLAKSLVQNEEMFRDHEIIRVFINKVPNDAKKLMKRIKQFRRIEYLCSNFPIWIEEYDAKGLGGNATDIESYFANLGMYLIQYPNTVKDVLFSNRIISRVEKIAFDLCVHGFGSWRERALMLQDLRSKMPEGFSVYMSESAVLALIVSSRSAVLKSVIITLICMAVICLVFFPTLRGAICAITSVASITIGVVGGLYVMGADLDTMVLVNIVMAVGLTVDFSAHISYHCFSQDIGLANPESLVDVLQAVAVPSVEAALTTVILVLPLYFYSVYMYVTFAKTVLLIALVGLIHTVFVIPFIISVTACRYTKKK